MAAWNGPSARSSHGPWARLPGREPLGESFWSILPGKHQVWSTSCNVSCTALTYRPQEGGPSSQGPQAPALLTDPVTSDPSESIWSYLTQPPERKEQAWKMPGMKLGCRQQLCTQTLHNRNLFGGFWKGVKSQRPWVMWSRKSKGSRPVWDMEPSSI